MTKEETRAYHRAYRERNAPRLKAQRSTASYRAKRSQQRQKKSKAMSTEEKRAAYEKRRDRRTPEMIKRDSERAKQWAARNKDRVRKYRSTPEFLAKKLQAENVRRSSPAVKKHIADRERNRRATDASYAIACRLRSRLKHAVNAARAEKSASTFTLLGCDIQFLRQYLEARFLPGMTWSNRNRWQIDHRIPCANFDLTNPAEQKQCFHYSNLQPMWTPDNARKKAKLPAPHQAELL